MYRPVLADRQCTGLVLLGGRARKGATAICLGLIGVMSRHTNVMSGADVLIWGFVSFDAPPIGVTLCRDGGIVVGFYQVRHRRFVYCSVAFPSEDGRLLEEGPV